MGEHRRLPGGAGSWGEPGSGGRGQKGRQRAAAAAERETGANCPKVIQARIRVIELFKAFSGKKGNSDKAQSHVVCNFYHKSKSIK